MEGKEDVKNILENLENGIRETLNSGNYKAFLDMQSKFHNYSFNNTMLIYIQNPNATLVNGYKTWQKLERQVRKGEKGIKIIAPSSYTYKKTIDKTVNGKKIINSKTGKIEKTTVDMKGLTFRKISVFDISQTEGKELPSICKELQGNSKSAEKIISAIKEISDVPIIEKSIDSRAKGYYNRSKNIIVLKENMSFDQKAETLIHEYTHSKLHNTQSTNIDRATKEVQAESVAYVVSKYFGIDTSDYSFEYLANWSKTKELKELKDSFNIIQKTSNIIIKKIGENMMEKNVKLIELDISESEYDGSYIHNGIIEIDDKKIKFGQNPATGDIVSYAEENGLKEEEFDKILDKKLEEYHKNKEIKNKIQKTFPNITDKTLEKIYVLNKDEEFPLLIKEIKEKRKEIGKEIENGNLENVEKFQILDEVVSDFKNIQKEENIQMLEESKIPKSSIELER